LKDNKISEYRSAVTLFFGKVLRLSGAMVEFFENDIVELVYNTAQSACFLKKCCVFGVTVRKLPSYYTSFIKITAVERKSYGGRRKMTL